MSNSPLCAARATAAHLSAGAGAIVAIVTLATVACSGSAAPPPASTAAAQPSSARSRAARHIPQGEAFQAFVSRGDPATAKKYYEDMASAQELAFPDAKPPADLDALLAYCGYSDVSAKQLKTTEFQKLDGEIVSARFFAPKITDVSTLTQPPAIGWRKVVRLRPKTGSGAENRGVTALFVLFNIFITDKDLAAGDDPFTKDAKNNQAILVVRKQAPPDKRRSAYFMVFGDPNNQQEDFHLLDFLTATFDARDTTIPTSPVDKYFVPTACAQCHGATEPKLNYLDTDHWFDRVQEPDDFHQVFLSKAGVVFDGGKITADGGTAETTTQYEHAFDVIRKLNEEISEQNHIVSAAGNFQIRAADNWLTRHKATRTYLPPLERPIPPPAPATQPVWSASDSTDKRLLPLLNRYCYRCHSSVKYNVFDKGAVKSLSTPPPSQPNSLSAIERRLTIPESDPNFKRTVMPQDRRLEDTAIKELVDLVRALHKQP